MQFYGSKKENRAKALKVAAAVNSPSLSATLGALAGVVLSAWLPTAISEPAVADAIVYNANVYSPGLNLGKATALAIKDGRIAYVGDDKAALAWQSSSTEMFDAQGRFLMPGINDAHSHPFQGGSGLVFNCDFAFDSKPVEITSRLTGCIDENPKAQWLEGGQWTSDFFTLNKIESPRKFLDQISTEVAIYLEDDSGHNAWVNSKALALVGIDKDSPNPEGGTIVRNKNGEANGVLLEMAAQHVAMNIPERSVDEYAQALAAAIEYVNAFGITASNEARTPNRVLQAYAQLDKNGKLTARINTSLQTWFGLKAQGFDLQHYIKLREQYRSSNVSPDFVKIFTDGVPTASRSALMLADYTVDHEHPKLGRGTSHLSEEELTTVLLALDGAGFTAKIHTAGDGSVRMALNAIERVRKDHGNTRLAHRLAHAGFIDPADIQRFVDLNVIADFSPYIWFPSPIIDSVVSAVGPRGEQYWPTADLLAKGVRILTGSDWPSAVETPNPWPAVEALVSRQNPFGSAAYKERSLWPEQGISRDDALRIFTLENAKAMGIDSETGTLAVGKSADFIVLNQNVLTVPVADISDTQVVKTWFRGKVVYAQAKAK